EEESERKSFLQLMDVGKIDVVQVDLTRCGGFTEAMKIASLAADRGLPVVNHGFTTYLNVAAALHFLASVPNTLGLLEFVLWEGEDNHPPTDQAPQRGGGARGSPPRAGGAGGRKKAGGEWKFAGWWGGGKRRKKRRGDPTRAPPAPGCPRPLNSSVKALGPPHP